MERKHPIKMPKCTPINTNPIYKMKKTDGCQRLNENLSIFIQLLPKMHRCNMAELKKEEVCHLVTQEVIKRWQRFFYFTVFTLFSYTKKIVQSCGYVGLSGRISPQYRANSKPWIYLQV